MKQDSALFFRLWLKSPLRIAACSPSGTALSNAMARRVDISAAEPVLELGGGTGSITAALLAAGLPPGKLYTIEKEPKLCEVLRRRFPAVQVIEGDATELGRLLRARGVHRLSAVVSSLPIIWLSLEQQRAIVEQSFEMMQPAGRLLQITNQPASPLPADRLGLSAKRVDYVWRNFPPSSVWQYMRPQAASASAAE